MNKYNPRLLDVARKAMDLSKKEAAFNDARNSYIKSLLLAPDRLTGDDLIIIRKALKSTALEIAKVISCNPKTYSRYENGRDKLTINYEKIFRLHAYDQLFPLREDSTKEQLLQTRKEWQTILYLDEHYKVLEDIS